MFTPLKLLVASVVLNNFHSQQSKASINGSSFLSSVKLYACLTIVQKTYSNKTRFLTTELYFITVVSNLPLINAMLMKIKSYNNLLQIKKK